MKVRLQKAVAESGLFSRREVERLIQDKLVRVNGRLITEQGVKIDPEVDKVSIAGTAVPLKRDEPTLILMLNKPRRVMVTRFDPEERQTVFDLLPEELHHFKPIGRLDYNTQGLLLLTNNSGLINRLTHPRFHLEKIYEVKTTQEPDEKQLGRLRRGIVIEGARTLPAKVEVSKIQDSSYILRFTLTEGKNRQIRNMCEAVGLVVKELRRIQFGPVKLGSLRSGQFKFLTKVQVRALKSALNGE